MTKCTFCKDRTDAGLKPACVAACYNRALDAGTLEEITAKYPNAVDTLADFDRSTTGPNIKFKAKAAKIG